MSPSLIPAEGAIAGGAFLTTIMGGGGGEKGGITSGEGSSHETAGEKFGVWKNIIFATLQQEKKGEEEKILARRRGRKEEDLGPQNERLQHVCRGASTPKREGRGRLSLHSEESTLRTSILKSLRR